MSTWAQLPGNDRKSLFNFSHRECKIASRDAVPARVRRPPVAVRESELAPYPAFCVTISDNGLLCQREIGLQAELDVASIWERVSHLDTSFTVSDKDLRIVVQAGGQDFDVLICINRSLSRVTRCRKCLSSFDRSRSCRTP